MQVGVFEEQRETWRTTAARSLNFWLLSGLSLRSSGTISFVHTSQCTRTTILWPTSWHRRGCQPLNKDGWMPWQGTTSPSSTDQESTTPMLMGYPGGHRSLSILMKSPATWHLFWGAQHSPCPCRRPFLKQSPYWRQPIKQCHSLRSSSPRHCLATQLLGLHSFNRQTQGYQLYCGFTSRAGALQQRRGRLCQRRQKNGSTSPRTWLCRMGWPIRLPLGQQETIGCNCSHHQSCRSMCWTAFMEEWAIKVLSALNSSSVSGFSGQAYGPLSRTGSPGARDAPLPRCHTSHFGQRWKAS